MKTKLPFKYLSAWAGLLIFFIAVTCIDTAAANGDGTRAKTISSTPSDQDLAQTLQMTSADTTTYTSPTFTADFPFNGVGLVWNGPASAQVDFALAIDDGPWQTLEMTGDEAKDQIEAFTSMPLFINGQKVRYQISGKDYNQVRNVRITYFDSTIPPQPSMLQSLQATLQHSLQSAGDTQIISRADWGADESYRTWEPDYSTPKKIVIHHTAGGDGGEDPAATIRGIYYWQATVLGWGDIGYNYLMDQQGNVYEGRYGGSGVIGAHAYNSNTETNYNVGSIGIAILGCFESTAGACSTTSTYTETIHASLAQLLGQLAVQEDIDPLGQKKWHGEKLPNILSHRDIDYTYCPGDLMYAELERIRQDAATTYTLLQSTTPKPYQATWQSQTIAENYLTTDQPTIDVTYNNVGQNDWTTEAVALQLSIAETERKQRILLPMTTTPGQATTFTSNMDILPQRAGTYTVVTKLYQAGRVIKGSTHRTTITVTPAYQATVTNLSLPLAIRQGWTPTLEFTVQNSGTQDWPAGVAVVVNQQTLKVLQQPVAVGVNKTITLPLTFAAKWPVGSESIVTRLQSDGITLPGSRFTQSLRIDP